MIYFTTFIFALLLAHVARAVPQAACGHASPDSPQEQYYTTYDDSEQLAPLTYNLRPEAKYDSGSTSSATLTCKAKPYGPMGLSYYTFSNFPSFPYIGGAQGATFGNPSCGQCLRLNLPGAAASGRPIYMLVVDSSQSGLTIGKRAFDDLTGNPTNPPTSVQVEGAVVPAYLCGLPSPQVI